MGFTDYSLVVGTSVIAGQLIVDTSGGFLYVVEDGTGYGVALNQSLRDTDSPIFANLTCANLTLGNLQVSEVTSTGFIYINNATPVLDFNNAAGNVTYLFIAYDGTEDIINASTYPLRIVSAKFNLDDNGNLVIGGNLTVETSSSYPATSATGMFYVDNHGLVRLYTGSEWEMINDSYLTKKSNGFPVNTSGNPNPSNQTTITFTNATRTFSLAPTGSSFSVYVNGTEFTFTTIQSVVITNTEGLWYFYFNSSGVLTASQSIWSLENDVVTAYVYWDATNTVCSYFADERHCFSMDWRTHYYLHTSIGTRYVSGLAISGYTLNTSGDTNVQIGIGNGTVFDEDLEFDIANGTSGTPASTPNFYNQPLAKPATIPVYYQVGATGVWRKTTTANFYIYPDANTRPYYNLNTAGTWSLADVPSGDVVSYWIFATNDIDNPIIAIMGQQINTTLTKAEANDVYSALSISSGLPFLEMKLLYQIILSVLDSYGGSTRSRVSVVNDFRSQSIGGTASSGTPYITTVGNGFSVAAGQLQLDSTQWSLDGLGDLSLVGTLTATTLLGNLAWSYITSAPAFITATGQFIQSVNSSYFSISGSELLFSGTHAQPVGTGDNPTFAGLTSGGLVMSITGADGYIWAINGTDNEIGMIFQRTGGANATKWYTYILATDTKMRWYNGGTVMTLDASGNLVITGKLTQSGCLPEDTPLEDVLGYIEKVQPLKSRETQTEVDALERIVLNQQKQIESLLKRLGND